MALRTLPLPSSRAAMLPPKALAGHGCLLGNLQQDARAEGTSKSRSTSAGSSPAPSTSYGPGSPDSMFATALPLFDPTIAAPHPHKKETWAPFTILGRIAPPPGLEDEVLLPQAALQATPHGYGALAASVGLAGLPSDEDEEDDAAAAAAAGAARGPLATQPMVPPPPCAPPMLDCLLRTAYLSPPPAIPAAGDRLPPPPPALEPPFRAALAMAAPTLLQLQHALAGPPGMPALGSCERPTVGSSRHALGECKPCAFVHTKGCANGVACTFCHLCDEGERLRRKKEKRVVHGSTARGTGGSRRPIGA